MRIQNHEFFEEKILIARTILEYNLLLEVTESISAPKEKCPIQDITKWIDNLFSLTYENCSKYDRPSNFFNIINQNSCNPEDLSFFDCGNAFWKFFLKQEAILFSYEKIREMIAAKYKRSTYNFVYLSTPYDANKGKIDFYNIYGLYYHYKSKNSLEEVFKKPSFSIENDFLNDSSDVYTKYNSHMGNTITTLKSLLNKLNNHFILDCLYDHTEYNNEQNNRDAYKFLMQANTLEFSQCVGLTYGNKNLISAKSIINACEQEKPSKKAFNKYCKAFSDLKTELYIPGLDKELQDYKTNNKLELADKIHCRYLIERIFSLSTIDCLYQNLSNPIEFNGGSLRVNDLKKCFLLPNPMSRHYIIQMAIDALKYQYSKEPDISTTSVAHTISHYTPETLLIEHDTIWRTRYKNMINLLYKYFFPIYNNYFFVALWDSIRRKESQLKTDPLDKAFSLLSQYLNDTDTVKKLFCLNDSVFRPYHYDTSKIIKPFNNDYNDPVNYELYFDCIKASASKKSVENNTDSYYYDFLNLDYIKNISPDIEKSIQKLYKDIIKGSP